MSVGQPLTRVEARGKVTGQAKYTADNTPPGLLYAVIVGAPVSAGRVIAIDADAALAIPGVIRILTRHDMPTYGKVLSPPTASERLPMQDDEILSEGEPVALALADTLEAAEAAAAAVVVRLAPSKPITPRALGEPLADDDNHLPEKEGRGGYAAYFEMFEADFSKGDAAAGLATAARRVEALYSQSARHPNPLEPSATLAQWNGNRVVLHDSTQHAPHVASSICEAFGVPLENIRVLSPHTGGAFGAKQFVWAHQLLAVAAARIMDRPVKLVLSRAQMYAIVGYQPLTRSRLALGCDEKGHLAAVTHACENVTAIREDYIEWATVAAKSLYAIPAMRLSQRVERVNINLSTPIRSPIEGPGTWVLESAMDELARVLEIDPLDLRLANFATTDPADGRPWSSNKLREAYHEGSELFGWRERASKPRRDGFWRIGHGMATCTTGTFRFPSKARVRIRADGCVIVETGTHDIGTGTTTIVTQIAARELGIDPGQVSVLWGDTTLPAPAPLYGSAATIGVGSAVLLAARDAKAKLAHVIPETDLAAAIRDSGITEVVGDGAFALPDGAEISENGSGTPYAMRTWGAIFVEVGVDPDLGIVRLRRAVGSYSAGRIMNPLTARSQMIGGIVWGWGMATMEQSVQEPRHGRWLAKNLSNIDLPVNADIPSDIKIHFVDEFDEYANPIGARGIGELGATGVAAAVANAVYDAIGVRVRDLPIVPSKLVAS